MTEIETTAISPYIDPNDPHYKLQQLHLLKAEKAKLLDELRAKIVEINGEYSDLVDNERAINREIRMQKIETERQTKLQEFRFMQESYSDVQAAITKFSIVEKFKANGAKDYQIEGASAAVAAQGFILAHSMGLGKTYQSILALRMISELTPELKEKLTKRTIRNGLPPLFPEQDYGKRALYICPKTLIPNVAREFQLWDSERATFVLDTSNYAFILNSINLINMPITIITNYEVWRRDKNIVNQLSAAGFGTIIVDESHNLKNTETVNFKMVREISRGIPFRILMTGTPILNRPDDIYTSLNLIAPAIFPKKHQFNMMYCHQTYVNGRVQWKFQDGGVKSLIRRTGNVIQKKTKEDVGIELPPLVIEEHLIEVDKEKYYAQWSAYKEMRDHGVTLMNDQGDALTATAMIAILTRLRQICILPYAVKNHLDVRLQIEESQKLDYVYELISEITRHAEENAEGERTVLFSQFTEPLRFIKKYLEGQGYKVALMIGETNDVQRDKIVRDLDAKTVENGGYYDIVLCNYKVGGIGLNFTDATQLILLDSEWNSGKKDQALARLHRVGQTKSVTVHKVLVDDTIDRWMEVLIESKDEMLDGFTSGLSQFEELKKLLLGGQ